MVVAAKRIEYPAMVMEEVVSPNGMRRMKPLEAYKPRAWYWLNVKQTANKSLKKVIGKEQDSNFVPTYTLPEASPRLRCSRSKIDR